MSGPGLFCSERSIFLHDVSQATANEFFNTIEGFATAGRPEARGMVQLNGHGVVGILRASIYNAMPVEGVKRLVEYMREFEANHR